ncbi:Hypp1594 [Branchiostoma lanceolatum]|uniref:Hypp1594 protein n=1 Tax=Branchiostoma lanceolatum TaxID=7740 RepID=A0A8K0ELJ8_BRALA|nr:Hypp1594 [Branchiostoma lanceolatum]
MNAGADKRACTRGDWSVLLFRRVGQLGCKVTLAGLNSQRRSSRPLPGVPCAKASLLSFVCRGAGCREQYLKRLNLRFAERSGGSARTDGVETVAERFCGASR